MAYNTLRTLTDSIGLWEKLEVLNIEGNDIELIPDSILKVRTHSVAKVSDDQASGAQSRL